MKPVTYENGNTVPVVEVKNSKVVGTKQEVDSEDWGDAARSLARRSKGSGKIVPAQPKPKLQPLDSGKSIEERLSDYGLA